VRLDGPITVATAWKLVARVAEAVERGETRLLLDLTRVTALDPAGVAALLEAQRLVEQRPGGTLALHPNRLVAAILTTSGTTGRFTLSHGAGM
jgi:anti-anti-sigma factor